MHIFFALYHDSLVHGCCFWEKPEDRFSHLLFWTAIISNSLFISAISDTHFGLNDSEGTARTIIIISIMIGCGVLLHRGEELEKSIKTRVLLFCFFAFTILELLLPIVIKKNTPVMVEYANCGIVNSYSSTGATINIPTCFMRFKIIGDKTKESYFVRGLSYDEISEAKPGEVFNYKVGKGLFDHYKSN
ncbi:hypothetical protein [Amphritea pacifica]|uniref:Uncharacterized protein n=1 Tax=Amphritea pacifica TaxID=2811233 RepID=A0ABS2WD02_9GAMM|nr:hypothetical protein [Amphritea pacifica]MBN0989242.1 hypothetical protein [Amphritea pacifica]